MNRTNRILSVLLAIQLVLALIVFFRVPPRRFPKAARCWPASTPAASPG
jgi:hypothetical protein